MDEIAINIAELVVNLEGSVVDQNRIEPQLRHGLDLLAQKLQSSPFARDPEGVALALTALEVSNLPSDVWLSTRGAERIADALYQQLTSHLGTERRI